MALIERPSPDEAKNAFLNIIEQPPAPPPGPGVPPPPPLFTLPVFVVGLRNLAQGIVTRGAKQVGWQFLTTGEGGVTISGDVPDSEPGGRPPSASRSQGPALEKAWAAYGDAERLDQVIASHYEPRALRIPVLHIDALWLRKKTDQLLSEQLDGDLVIPFHTFNPQLSAQPVFTMRQFLSIAQPLAQQQLKSSSPRD